MPFLMKKLSKDFMTRSRLPNDYLKNRNEENNKRQNMCISKYKKGICKTKKLLCFSALRIQKKILRKLRLKNHSGQQAFFGKQ